MKLSQEQIAAAYGAFSSPSLTEEDACEERTLNKALESVGLAIATKAVSDPNLSPWECVCVGVHVGMRFGMYLAKLENEEDSLHSSS